MAKMLFELIRVNRVGLLVVFCLEWICEGFSVGLPLYLRWLWQGNKLNFIFLCIGIVILLFRQLAVFIRDWFSVYWVEMVVADIRKRLFYPLLFYVHEEMRKGEKWVVLTKDVDIVRSFLSNVLLPTINGIVALSISIVAIDLLFPVLLPYFLLVMVGFFLLYWLLGRTLMKKYRQLRETISFFLCELETLFKGWIEVWLYGLEGPFKKRIYSLTDKEAQTRREFFLISSIMNLWSDLLVYGGGIGLVLFGLYEIRSGRNIALGDVLIAYVLFMYLSRPVMRLARIGPGWSRFFVSGRRIWKILSVDNNFINTKIILPTRAWSVVCRNVRFGYNVDRLLFDGVSIELGRGECLVIAGPNGSGKSTFLKLLLGLLKPISGSVIVEDEVVSTDLIWANRDRIAVVFENGFWFSGSLRENLLHSVMGVSDRELLGWLEFWGLDLPLDMRIEPMGSNLSTGQKKKLGLIRAVIRRPSLLIVDELLANLDALGREKAVELVRKLKGKTTLVITTNLVGLGLEREANKWLPLN